MVRAVFYVVSVRRQPRSRRQIVQVSTCGTIREEALDAWSGRAIATACLWPDFPCGWMLRCWERAHGPWPPHAAQRRASWPSHRNCDLTTGYSHMLLILAATAHPLHEVSTISTLDGRDRLQIYDPRLLSPPRSHCRAAMDDKRNMVGEYNPRVQTSITVPNCE
jgi:hypothetical protein